MAEGALCKPMPAGSKKSCFEFNIMLLYKSHAGVAELADAPDLGSGEEIRAGSTPVTRTIIFVSRSMYEVFQIQ